MRSRPVVRSILAQDTSDGAGVRLRRSLGSAEIESLDPFLLLDEFKSERSDDYIAGFPDHPHRGFETVTYMLAGAMEHKDSRGNRGELTAGSIQWMTAGRGIIHSEMPRQADGLMWGFQLWVNLPAREKMREPRYQDIPATDVPEVRTDEGARVRIVAGECAGFSGPVSGIVTDPLYLDVRVEKVRSFEQAVPPAHNACAYVFEGEVELGFEDETAGEAVSAGHLAVFGDGDRVRARPGSGEGRFLLVAAKPIGEPVARHGPFVMNTRDEIRQAVQDFKEGRLA